MAAGFLGGATRCQSRGEEDFSARVAEQILEKSRGALQQLRGSLNPDSIQGIERSLFSDDSPQRDASRPRAAGKRKHLLANNRFLV